MIPLNQWITSIQSEDLLLFSFLTNFRKRPPSINIDAKSLYIQICSFRTYNQYEKKLSLVFADIEFQSEFSGEVKKLDRKRSNVRSPKATEPPQDPIQAAKSLQFSNAHRFSSFKVGKVHIFEQVFENGAFEQITLVQSKIICSIYECLNKNHPLFVDTKLKVWIPFLAITIDDKATFLLEILRVFNNSCKKTAPPEQTAQCNQKYCFIERVSENQSMTNYFIKVPQIL